MKLYPCWMQLFKEANELELPEITNFYYLYLLQQVSRLNMYFCKPPTIVDTRKGTATFSSQSWTNLDIFSNAKISAIDHPLLSQPANTSMSVTVSRGMVFADD